SKKDALETWALSYSEGDIDRMMAQIKPVLSNLRETIREAIGIDSNSDPLPWGDAQQGWRSGIEIGYAVMEDGERIRGTNRLRFKTHDQLSADEEADCR